MFPRILDIFIRFIYFYVKKIMDQGEGINTCIAHKKFLFWKSAGITKGDLPLAQQSDYINFGTQSKDVYKYHMYPLLVHLGGGKYKHIQGDGSVKMDGGQKTRYIVLVAIYMDPSLKRLNAALSSLQFAQSVGSMSAHLKTGELIKAACDKSSGKEYKSVSPKQSGGSKLQRKSKLPMRNHRSGRKSKQQNIKHTTGHLHKTIRVTLG